MCSLEASLIHSEAHLVTSLGSLEKLRPSLPMTGQAGLTLTSTQGAKLRLTPASASSRAMIAALLVTLS